jgi:murein DD-endopeptidase
MPHFPSTPNVIVVLTVCAGLAGCASMGDTAQRRTEAPSVSSLPAAAQAQPQSVRTRVATIADDMVGAPYRYGGADPRGFDCSGLVYYVYRQAGAEAPRTTSEQYRQSRHVRLSRLLPGDLLFFRMSRRKPSHVGIYVGHGRFVHAPSSGKAVDYASLDDDYWREHLIGAGRLLHAEASP